MSAATRSPEYERAEVVVVGAGHAGCEAASACVNLGLRTILLTADLADTARMSCNPAIGGIAKGHMVREIDALGGVMAQVTDRAGIQFKTLNRGRGPAVWSPRAQCDKARYSREMSAQLDRLEGLVRVAGIANRVRLEHGRAAGVELDDGRVLLAAAVVITPGTFLDGVIHIGPRTMPGGRIGEHAARALSECLASLGLERGRLKTGTPPRLHRDSIDWEALTPQPGDEPPEPLSHWTESLALEQAMCWLTHTNEGTHRAIRDTLHLSPMTTGAIRGIGPRYCPSIEDKVTRFADKPSHSIFLEPEGTGVPEIYVNGFSTSLPEEAQLAAVRTIRGLERAEMMRPGYAVEYDFVLPHQLTSSLEVKGIPGVFLAGQICGTSGYEEAAAQGLIAGVNAARSVRGEPPFVLRRDQAYVGVLVDDLVTREHREPYRMFTSAAEHRLLLRADNADERLAEIGQAIGLLPRERLEAVRAKYARIEAEERRLSRVSVTVPARLEATIADDAEGGAERDGETAAARKAIAERASSTRTIRALDLLARPDSSLTHLESLGVGCDLPRSWGQALEVRVRYRGYIERQCRAAERAAEMDELPLPTALWERELNGLSREAREKLTRWKPATVGQAGRIAGVSPSDVAVLLVHAKRLEAR